MLTIDRPKNIPENIIDQRSSFACRLGFMETNGTYHKEIGGEVFTFKSITSYADFQATIPVQKESFKIKKNINVCPADMLATLDWTGGMVIAGYNSANEAASFIYLWPTREVGTYVLDMIGVANKYQDKSVGKNIFEVLILEAIKRGDIKKINLTYDPLMVRNANLYIKKMGGEVTSFKHNPYGEALAGDRFVVSYDLTHPLDVIDRISCQNNNFESINLCDLPQVRDGNYPDEDIVVLPAPSKCKLRSKKETLVVDSEIGLPVSREQY